MGMVRDPARRFRISTLISVGHGATTGVANVIFVTIRSEAIAKSPRLVFTFETGEHCSARPRTDPRAPLHAHAAPRRRAAGASPWLRAVPARHQIRGTKSKLLCYPWPKAPCLHRLPFAGRVGAERPTPRMCTLLKPSMKGNLAAELDGANVGVKIFFR